MTQEPKRTVRAKRRRRTASSSPRQQAEAPTRDQRPEPLRPSPTSPRPPSGGGGTPALPSFSGSGGGGKMGCLVLVVLIILAVLYLVFKGMAGAPAERPPVNPPPTTQAPTQPQATPTPVPAPPEAATGEGDTWLVMLYQDADDKILEKDIVIDLNEAERAGSSPRVQVVAQVDRYRGGFRGDGNWTTAKRFYVTYDPDLDRLASQELMDLGEVNMADGETLVDFVRWAAATYPADHYVLILSDHGMGWPGGWSDPTARGRGADALPLASAMGDHLFLTELDRALAEIQRTTDIQRFDLIGLDACLMAHAEVFDALRPYARYAVASQETEPAVGWAYASFLRDLLKQPDMPASTLGQRIVMTYIDQDQRILDDRARTEMLGRRVSARQVIQQMYDGATLSAVDLDAFAQVMDALNRLAFRLQDADQDAVAKARGYAQSYTGVFGRNARPSYLDLGNFVQILQREVDDPQVQEAGDALLRALDEAVVAETHGRNKPGSHGISIYFPSSKLFFNRVAGLESYTATADRFARESLWDEFLTYHYTGRRFQAQSGVVASPPPSEQAPPPGQGQIQVSPIHLSTTTAAAGEPVLIRADIQGENIGYIYLFIGMLDPEAQSLFVADMDFLESGQDHTVDGVTYPDWGEGPFTLEFEWEPLFFGIDDGAHTVTALFAPLRYGAKPEDAVYTVDGIYTYADGEQRYARLHFDNGTGQLKQVFGYTNQDFSGAAREILPQPGDQFTVLEKWFDLDAQGKKIGVASEPGGTVTFGDAPLVWRELNAPPGTYEVGFVVQDLAGNSYPVYASVTVK